MNDTKFDKAWFVKLSHGGDQMNLTFTSENDYSLFRQNLPSHVAITDIQERTAVGYITAMELVGKFAPQPTAA